MYVNDVGNNRIRKVNTSGIITTIAGNGIAGASGDGGPALLAELYGIDLLINSAPGLASDLSGNILIADTGNSAIRGLAICIQSLPTFVAVDGSSQSLTVPVAAVTSCAWSAANLPSWISYASNGTGTGQLSLELEQNTTGADRSATITVNGLALTVTQAFTTQQFTDVSPAAYYFDAVNRLSQLGITAGCGGTDFCPADLVTRDQMAILIVRTILGTDSFTYNQSQVFADVPPTAFAFKWIQKLYELGVTAGCAAPPELLYCPDEIVTRDQMAILIIRARYGATTDFTWQMTPLFSDVPSSYFAFEWIQRMKEDNITDGCGQGTTYCPSSPVSRGDMAIFLVRGGFNQLLPATEPAITSISPNTLAPGAPTTLMITGSNTNFVQDTTALVFPASSGITVNSITVNSPTSMQVSLTASQALAAPLSIYEQTGAEEAVLPNALTIQEP